MTEALAVSGALLAWLGAALLALSDGRRGLALGLALAGAGLAIALTAAGEDRVAAAALAVSGVCAAALHLGRGPREWGMLLQGSTPRLIGSVVALIVTALVAGPAIEEPAGAARLGALVAVILAGARLLTAGRGWAALGAGSALALGLGALGDPPALFLAALVAPALGLVNLAVREGVAE